MVVKRVTGWPHAYGGDECSGWLPPGAVQPLPTPIRHVLVDLKIEAMDEDDPSAGFLLRQSAQDGSFCWDSWHDSVASAEAAAAEQYKTPSTAWSSP
jgi:hypothetical protein